MGQPASGRPALHAASLGGTATAGDYGYYEPGILGRGTSELIEIFPADDSILEPAIPVPGPHGETVEITLIPIPGLYKVAQAPPVSMLIADDEIVIAAVIQGVGSQHILEGDLFYTQMFAYGDIEEDAYYYGAGSATAFWPSDITGPIGAAGPAPPGTPRTRGSF